MKTYQLLIDTWEGQMEVDEDILRANGVAGMIIRLNDMNGGHHMDENFLNQWEQARNMVRAPYFVYNPWVDGAANFAWLNEHMPSGATAVLVDIEVRYSGITAAKYAADVSLFIDLAKRHWKVGIYTAEWFLPFLSFWRNDVPYWWAQYPGIFYPNQTVSLSWDDLRAKLEPLSGPFNAAKCPGPLRMWQFTGDKLILPGCNRVIDVNVFFGTLDELEEWLGGVNTTPPPSDGGQMVIDVISLTHDLSMRPLHQVVGSSSFLSIPKGTTVKGVELWVAPDTVVGVVQKGDTWAHVAYGGKMGWVALIHLGKVYGTYTESTPPPGPPPADATITGVRFSGEVVFDLADGTQEVWHVTDMPFVKGPAI